ncbi:MAG: HAMP domain-containing protein [Bacteroidales bacterium]|nr:HAMP domain-containing protein [Bacteroidales bacterium]
MTDLDSLNLSWLWEKVKNRHETFVSDYYFDDQLMKPVIYLANPVFENSVLIGMICLEISIDVINSIMYKTNPMNGLGNTGEAYLVGDDFLMRSSSRFDQNSILKTRVETDGVKSAFEGLSGSSHYNDYRGIEVLGSHNRMQIQGLNWIIMAEIDLDEAMIPIYTIRNSVLLISVVVSAFIFALAYIISMQISRPIIQLKNAANQIAQGKYRIIEQNHTEDEMGELIKAFNSMVAQLEQKNIQIVKERAMRIRSMIDGQESERIRIARELHDGLGQYILAIKMKLERLQGITPGKISTVVEEAKHLLGITAKEIRSMSENLIPPVLSEFGLIPAIENLCIEIEKNVGIKVDFSFPEIEKQCDAQLQIYLYRIIQEALTNIAKHSGASEVNISIGIAQQALQLIIADNGHGFSTSKNHSKGNGLTNMKDRVEILGGNFTIHSDQNGTKINIIIPDFYE